MAIDGSRVRKNGEVAANEEVVKTGDNNHVWIYVIVLVAAVVIFGTVIVISKKNNKKYYLLLIIIKAQHILLCLFYWSGIEALCFFML